MECAKYAFTGNGTHQVQMKASHGNTEQNQESKSVYLAFEYFGNETLDYDPTLGVLSTAANPLDITTMLLVGGSAAAVIVVAALIVKMRG